MAVFAGELFSLEADFLIKYAANVMTKKGEQAKVQDTPREKYAYSFFYDVGRDQIFSKGNN